MFICTTYTVICFCVWVPHTVHRLVTAVHPSALEPLWEFGLTHVFLNLEGFMYAIAFSQVPRHIFIHIFIFKYANRHAVAQSLIPLYAYV